MYTICVQLAASRAKFGESAFLEAYQKLYEAPDPATALLHSAVSQQRFACTCQMLSFVCGAAAYALRKYVGTQKQDCRAGKQQCQD